VLEDKDWIQVALEEYRTLRSESLDSISQAQTTLRGGVVALGVLTGLSVKVESGGTVAHFVLAVAVPALAIAALMQWLLETRRAVRAGTQIAVIEAEIEQRFDGAGPLQWERLVRAEFSPDKTFAYHWTVVLALLTAALPPPVLGLVALADHGKWGGFVIALLADLALFVAMVRFMRANHRELTSLHGR
jgi:hypothetical protein